MQATSTSVEESIKKNVRVARFIILSTLRVPQHATTDQFIPRVATKRRTRTQTDVHASSSLKLWIELEKVLSCE